MVYKAHYESLNEALNAGFGPCSWPENKRSSRTGSAKFTDTKDYVQAVSLARNGWPEGTKKIFKGLESISALQSLAMAPAFTFDVAGSYPMAALAAAGEICNMVNLAPVSERHKPVIRLGHNIGVSGMYEASEICNYGAALCGIIDALEASEYRVELTTILAAETGHKEKCFISVKVKEAEDSLDLPKMAFVLAHAAYFRRIIFALMETHCPTSWKDYNYGWPRIPEASELEPDMILLAGAQMFQQGSYELTRPERAFAGMIPVVESLLKDRFADFPALQFKQAA